MIKIRKLLAGDKAALAAILIPIVLLGGLILTKAVNTVFWDEWEQVSIFQHINGGHLYFNDFWRQHNEHRILFPTIGLVIIEKLTHWNVIIECLANFAVAIVSYFVLLNTLRTTSKTSKLPPVLLLLLGLIWFSPVQVENWLWGWQLEWFMSVLGVVLVGTGLSRVKKSVLSRWALTGLLAGGILAQYSLGNGTLVWPIAIACLIYQRLRIRQLALVAGTALVTTALYYWHYVTPVGAPSRGLAIHEPVGYAKFVLLYLGRPLSYLHQPAMLLGFILVSAFLLLSVYLFIREKARFNRSIPWIFLGLYAIATAMVTGLARLGFGVAEGSTSRYTTISLLLLISTVVLYWQNKAVLRGLVPEQLYKSAATGAVFMVFAFVLANAYWGVHAFNTQHRLLTYLKTCTSQLVPSDECLVKTYPDPVLGRERVEYLKSLHWGGY
jgi:hypothetical protein